MINVDKQINSQLAHYVPLAVYLTGKGVFKNRLQVTRRVLNGVHRRLRMKKDKN